MKEVIGKTGNGLSDFCKDVKLPLGKLHLTEISNISPADYKGIKKSKSKTLVINEKKHITFGIHTLNFEKVVREPVKVNRI